MQSTCTSARMPSYIGFSVSKIRLVPKMLQIRLYIIHFVFVFIVPPTAALHLYKYSSSIGIRNLPPFQQIPATSRHMG